MKHGAHSTDRFVLLHEGGKRSGKRGGPRRPPGKLHADKGYDYPRCRRFLRKRGIRARIARRGVESRERLGRQRWVVKRTFAWLSRYRGPCIQSIPVQRRRHIQILLQAFSNGTVTPATRDS